jgi:hypothetical protein
MESGSDPRNSRRDRADAVSPEGIEGSTVGRCWLEPTELRAPKALSSTQAFRIAQDLPHLAMRRIGEPDRPLTDSEWQRLGQLLNAGRDLVVRSDAT